MCTIKLCVVSHKLLLHSIVQRETPPVAAQLGGTPFWEPLYLLTDDGYGRRYRGWVEVVY